MSFKNIKAQAVPQRQPFENKGFFYYPSWKTMPTVNITDRPRRGFKRLSCEIHHISG